MEFARDEPPAGPLVALDDDDLQSGARKQRCGRQTIGAGADNGHVAFEYLCQWVPHPSHDSGQAEGRKRLPHSHLRP